MADADRGRWDARYRQGAYQDRTHPSAFLAAHVDRAPIGEALDLACGAGRNANFLASRGFTVNGWDISVEALGQAQARAEELALDIDWRSCDLERVTLPKDHYDLVIQIRYVNWALVGQAIDALRPGGVFLSEQHLVTDRDVVGPSNPAFRATPGQLRAAVSPLAIEIYEELHTVDPDGRAVALARVLARRDASASRCRESRG